MEKTKSIYLGKWIEKVNLKENEHEKDESYLFSTKRNQWYDLILVKMANGVSIDWIERH